ncbi:MAG: 3-isopropylmalate dehydratase [Candidatus Kapabacteria bacterium]|nr:3-isopropylmalate dehydratase [Candidatus Kapabacteria bacterium]
MLKVTYKFEDDISTDIIYPGRYMATVLPSETPQYAFDDITELNKILNSSEKLEIPLVIAGKNFGCGSSREQAASTLKGHNVIVIARDFARIFLQNSINLGLRTIICPDIEAQQDDEIEITESKVINNSLKKEFNITPLPAARQAIIDAGGLIPYAREVLVRERGNNCKI